MSQYFHHSFRLEEEPRIMRLQQSLWLEGIGIFWTIYRQLRLCNGKYPLEALLLLAKGSKPRERKIIRVVQDFDLFTIENGIVQLQSGLSAAELNPDRDVSPRDKVAEIRQRINEGYDQTFFPEECREMDQTALERAQQSIRDQNQAELGRVYGL